MLTSVSFHAWHPNNQTAVGDFAPVSKMNLREVDVKCLTFFQINSEGNLSGVRGTTSASRTSGRCSSILATARNRLVKANQKPVIPFSV